MHIFHKRQGQMDFEHLYFFTETISDFARLLDDDNLKMIIINSWKYLIEKELIDIYGYVIMPNHLHLLWTMLKMNGKETPAESFSKFTGHEFKRYLLNHSPTALENFATEKKDRSYQFWKRDPLAVQITSEDIFIQKLEYIHNNPLKEKWQLADKPENYRWSSANFYVNGIDEFSILKHYRDDD